MSKGWPDPFTDRGDDFWDFDNMVNEYEYEQRRKAGKRLRRSKEADIYMPEFQETRDDRLSFTQADKIKIEVLLLENSSKDECTDVVFKVSNTLAFPIEFFKIYYNVCNRSGKILCDGIACDFNVIRPGCCTAVRDSIWPENAENEFRREDISNIQICSYEYTIDGFSYSIDIENCCVSTYDVRDNDRNADFGTADIICFDVIEQEYEGKEWLDVTYNVTNRSGVAVDDISFTVCFYDEAGMCIGEDGGYVEELSPGSSDEAVCTFYIEFDFQNAASFEVVKYEYMLKAPDRYGCRHYIVDRVQLTAKGREN